MLNLLMAIETKRDYYNYSGNQPRDAKILEVRPYSGRQKTDSAHTVAVILDATIFYPEGGGQPGDRGTINGLPLADVIEEDDEILHLISFNEPERAEKEKLLAPGKAVLLLDHMRRRDFTVAHTAQHLLSGILYRVFGIPTMSAHFGDEQCYIDIECPELKEENMLEAENMVMNAIEANRPITVHLCPPEDAGSFPLRKKPPAGETVIRIVEIQSVDYSPCCGTHLGSTGEIGMLRILEAEKYKVMTRVKFIAGRRCLNDSRMLRKNAEQISRVLSVPIAETGQGVLDFVEKTKNLELELKNLKEETCQTKAEALLKKQSLDKTVSGKTFTIVTESYKADMNDILNIGKKTQKSSGLVFILFSETENKFAAFCGNKEIDIRPLFLDKLEKYGIKGGGGPSFFQGSFGSGEELKTFVEDFSQRTQGDQEH